MRAKAKTAAGQADEPGKPSREAPLRPGQCRAYMRRELAREFRGIVQGFVESAKTGSCQHVKLATELVNTPVRRRVRRKDPVEMLLERMDREADAGLGESGTPWGEERL